MQRVAILSFVGVIVLLLAFTAHESGKQAATRPCKNGQASIQQVDTTGMLASLR